MGSPPLILFEDEHLLVINKPAGWNTHAPSPHAGEGVYEWLRGREPRWAHLAIIHRLDKETSGVLVFSKTTLASRSLTAQFTERAVQKKYLMLTDRMPARTRVKVRSRLARAGDKHGSQSEGAEGVWAETRFSVAEVQEGRVLVVAEPLTGRTHQVRVHAAEHGFPVLGDTLYGGTAAPRVFLHATELVLRHPATGQQMAFSAAADFAAESAWALRQALIETELTEAYRVLHGAAEGRPGWYVDRLGPFLLSQSERELDSAQGALLADWLGRLRLRGVYHQRLDRCVRASTVESASPRRFLGEVAPAEFVVRENGVKFALSFAEGYSVGLFLDQRDNRRRLLRDCVGADFPVFAASAGRPEILNLFAYTCGFSVCAALAGARTTSVDVSRKYLAWGRRNFELNGLDAAAQEFLHGDAFVWLRRLARKGRAFEVVLVDPPAFSTSKERGVFRAESDYGKLVAEALPLVKAGGVLFASTSARRLTPKQFLSEVESAIQAGKRTIVRRHYAPQPPDFPVTRAEPAHLKSIWLRLA